ncbi:MAG: hypothetical protein MJ247_05200 [Alphaproteobacteria bacterium]|nr:hypothetical protein [Alphaproteobacteria bacterium]
MSLRKMIVCDKNGAVDEKGSCCIASNSDGYIFYAEMDVKSKIVEQVVLVMPIGGEQNGLFRFPHIGEKVLVERDDGTNGTNYLMGYIPSNDDNFSKEEQQPFDKEIKEVVETQDALLLRYNSKDNNKTVNSNRDEEYSQAGFVREDAYWKTKDKEETKQIPKYKISSAGDIEQQAENYFETSSKRVGIFAGYNDEINKSKSNFIDKKNNPNKTYSEGVFPAFKGATDNDFKQGDVRIQAKECIQISADKEIIINVGRSTIKINDDGINLVSGKTKIPGSSAWDSAISINSLKGVNIIGSACSMLGKNSVAVNDNYGGSYSSLAGVTTIKGAHVITRSHTKLQYAIDTAFGMANQIFDLTSLIKEDKGVTKSLGIVSKSLDIVEKMTGAVFHEKSFTDNYSIINVLYAAKIAMSLLNGSVAVSMKCVKGKQKDDVIKAKEVLEAGILDIVRIIILASAKAAVESKSSIAVGMDGEISILANIIKRYGQIDEHGNAPLAGFDMGKGIFAMSLASSFEAIVNDAIKIADYSAEEQKELNSL